MASFTFINSYLSSQFDFVLSEFAFLVECTNGNAGQLLQLNQRWIHDGYEQPIQTSPSFDQDDEERATPCVDNEPSAWLFPRWQASKTSYVFGAHNKSDIVLPRKSKVSKKHFSMYLNEQGVWIVENHSQFGTVVNGDLLENVSAIGHARHQPSLEMSRHSITPGTPNAILAGGFTLIIHSIPHGFTPSTIEGGSISSLLDVSRIGLDSETGYSSTVGTLDSTIEPARAPTDIYYYLENGPIHVRGRSKVVIALHKRTGIFFVAKVYDKSQDKKTRLQYETVLELKNQKNIIPYLALLETEADFKIITSYLDVEPLANIMGSINLELAFLIYRQIAGALQSLEDHGIEHNDINESTTLIEYKADRHMAYLTGFSEFSTAKADSSSGFQRDLCSLTQIVRSTLSTYKGQPCCDPGLESIISKALKKQLAASDVCHMLEEIATSYEGFPFRKLSITKVMSLKRIVDENNVEAIRLLDLLKIVLHHNAHSKSMDLLIRKVIRKERLFQLNNETFCYLEDAEKLMFHLKSNLSIFLDLSPPQHKEACWYETEHAIDFSISYHKPSGMVNITQILNLLDDNIVNSCLEGISPSYQQVCGSDQWEGYYIDSESTDEVLRRLNLETNQSYRMAHETPPRDIFYNNDPSQFIIIASPEMIGLVFLQRDGTAVKLNGNTKSVEATVQECEKHGLSVTARAVQTYIPSEPDWKSYDGTSQVIKRFDEPNCPSEATEHSSFYDPEERTRFTLRKRKAPSDVPVLPKPTRSRVEQTTVTEICQSWTKEVGADIRPSRFGKR